MPERVRRVPRLIDKEDKTEFVNLYVDKMKEAMKEVFPSNPIPPPFEYKTPEPPRFYTNSVDLGEVRTLVNAIMEVLNGQKISAIVVASNIVEHYVIQQQNVGMGPYPIFTSSLKR